MDKMLPGAIRQRLISYKILLGVMDKMLPGAIRQRLISYKILLDNCQVHSIAINPLQ